MIEFRNIIDTWTMVEDYNIKGYIDKDAYTVLIPKDEFLRVLDSVKSKKYLMNLRK